MKTKKLVWFLGALLTMSVGCKRTGSRLKSLDNFTGVSSRSNLCIADSSKKHELSQNPMTAEIRFIGPIASGMDVPLKTKLQHAIVNIPYSIQRVFAQAAGKVVVADNSKNLCDSANVVKTSARDDEHRDSCLVFIAASSQNKQILHLVLPPDMGRIQHNIMRLTGLFVADLLPMVSDGRSDQIAEFRSAVSIALLNDILNSKAVDSTKVLNHLGSTGFSQAIRGAVGSDKKISLDKFSQAIAKADEATSAELKAFSRSAFIEGFDSWFCNSWAPADAQDLGKLAKGDVSSINRIYNTRATMKALFPETHDIFAEKIEKLLAGATNLGKEPAKAKSSNNKAAGGFALSDDLVMWDANGDGKYGPLETGASMVATLGRSLFWGQTTKPVAQAYGRYSQRVNEAWDRGEGLLGGYATGAKNSYKEDVATPIGNRAEAVFNQQVAGGADVNTAFRNTLGVELLRPTGATQFTESAILGQRFDGSQYRDGYERASDFAFGVGGLASTATLPLSLMPQGAIPAGPGIAPTAAEITQNGSALKSIGVDPARAARYAEAFEGGTKVVDIPAGTSLYRYGEGPGSWLSRTPVRDPVNSLALPVQSESTATQLNRFVTTRPVSVVEGGVSPQPGWASQGNPKLGGAGQIYMNYGDAMGGALSKAPLQTVLEQGVIPAAGSTSISGGISGGTNNGRSDDTTEPGSGDFSDSTDDTSGGGGGDF